jgi:hypothetical protein
MVERSAAVHPDSGAAFNRFLSGTDLLVFLFADSKAA